MPLAVFEPTISAGQPQQTYASDRAATETGFRCITTLPKSVSDLYRQPNNYNE
jgi:hypothetical protein